MSGQQYVFALAGNQNSGKTTLFNVLTGSNQHVGNWPGVTVEQKTGILIHHHHGSDAHFGLPAFFGRSRQNKEDNTDVKVVDLPGIYSLSPFTMEEIVTRNFITRDNPDLVINIIDATNLERNLYLTLQLLQLNTPMVIALNMMDEVKARGDIIHTEQIEKTLGIPVVAICARNGEGIDELVRVSMETAIAGKKPNRVDICGGAAHKALHAIRHLVETKAEQARISSDYAATKLIEGDEPMQEALRLTQEELHVIGEIVSEMEETVGMERAAVMADTRYTFIERMLETAYERRNTTEEMTVSRSDKIDRFLTHPLLSIPIFLIAMLLVFWITFGPFGTMISDAFSALIDKGIAVAAAKLEEWQVAVWARRLAVDGVMNGVGSVLTFMPTIVILFMLLSILEDSGYMARAAFLMDKPLRKIGLNGRSFIPLMTGFGCTVPAVMSSRSMSSRRDRRFTILLIPFMSCGAKVPVYALFASAFFGGNKLAVMCCLYLGGVILAVLSGLIMKNVLFHGDAAPFVMELPAYRLPTPRNVLKTMWDKAKDFVQRAFTVIFIATVIIWFLQSFTPRLELTDEIEASILAKLAGWIAPVFEPLGFGNFQAVTALLCGIMAKESVVSTLAILTRCELGSEAMFAAMSTVFSGSVPAVIAFLVFVLLYMPCIAAVAAMNRELESKKWTVLTVIGQMLNAWAISWIVYRIALLLL